MSFHTFFGACATPPGSDAALRDMDAAAAEFHGSSRSGAFQGACRLLLDAAPGHEPLRFLSAEATSHDASLSGEHLTFSRIDAAGAPVCIALLDALLLRCAQRPAELAALWSDRLGGCSAEDIVAARRAAGVFRNLNEQSLYGEDGDSPHFVLAALVTLRAAIDRAGRNGTELVYFNWRPDRDAEHAAPALSPR